MQIKLLIIDDSTLVRKTLTEVLNSDPELIVSGTAPDPIVAVRMIRENRPDVIISDIEMARMDGLTFLRKLNETVDPIPCVICSSLVTPDSPQALKAYELGACEVILKPAVGTKNFFTESKILICDAVKSAYSCTGKIKSLIPSAIRNHAKNFSSANSSTVQNDIKTRPVEPKLSADVILEKPDPKFAPAGITEPIVVIGASTGGTEALRDFLSQLPEDSPGMLVVQHMPEHFTQAFAERLNSLSKVTVKEAVNNERVEKGKVLIAPGNHHMLLKRDIKGYFVEIKDGPLVSRHRPSVDVLFRSAARYGGKNIIGVIMTGMGDDGSHGMKEMHDSGAFNFAQDEKTSIVWGMPGEAVKAGAVDKVLPLQDLAPAVVSQSKLMTLGIKNLSAR